MKNNPEDQICMALANWFYLQHRKLWECFMHIPNGGKRGKREAGIFKAMGLRPGASDYFLSVPKEFAHGLWLEVKTDQGSCSPAQRDFLRNQRSHGYMAVVGFGIDECREIITAYLESNEKTLDNYRHTYTKARTKLL